MASIDDKKIIAHLNAKWVGRACPLCGVANWNVQNSTFQLMEFHAGSVVIGGPVIPVVPVTCTNCGNTVLVNALIAGVVQPEAKEPQK